MSQNTVLGFTFDPFTAANKCSVKNEKLDHMPELMRDAVNKKAIVCFILSKPFSSLSQTVS